MGIEQKADQLVTKVKPCDVRRVLGILVEDAKYFRNRLLGQQAEVGYGDVDPVVGLSTTMLIHDQLLATATQETAH